MTDAPQDPQLEPVPEPSVLDYLKSRLFPGRHPRVEISRPSPSPASRVETSTVVEQAPETTAASASPMAAEKPQTSPTHPPGDKRTFNRLPWRALMALGLALLAQSFYEPPASRATLGSVLYLVAAAVLAWSALRGEWVLAPPPADVEGKDPLSYRRMALIASIPLATLAFLFFGGNLFTRFNLTLWLAAIGLFMWALWLRDPGRGSAGQRLRLLFRQQGWNIRINGWTLLVLAAVLMAVFFRVYHIQQTPAEPFSDHAEKLLDVYDVSQGQTRIFFPRNTGREAIQMYWTLLMSWIFGTGLSFLTLKIGTVLIGLLTLPYMYLLGKEVASRRVGLLAFVLTAVGYWPNLIARIGLRFPLYPMFVAPLLFYLVRGLRTRNRNDFILSGVFLGLGLHGYSPFRIVPLLLVAAFALYALHTRSARARWESVIWLAIAALTSLLIFLPLFRYALENPDSFSYRALTRLEGIEQPLPAPWLVVFASNTWNALRMFNWNNGNIWVHSVPDRPALDVVAGALFLAGVCLLVVRYAQRRHWLDLFLLLSIPILLLPSILSLAFPGENPSLNRTAGALVPVFLVAALALDGFISAFGSGKAQAIVAYGLTGLLLWGSASQSFQLVFNQFDRNFRQNAWNSSEMGAVIKEFGLVYGETDSAWVVPFPYWVDTRLVGVWAGIPNRDFAIPQDQLSKTLEVQGPKLFIAKASLTDPGASDQKTVDVLRQTYPQGSISLHRSPVEGHDFWIYFVPAASTP